MVLFLGLFVDDLILCSSCKALRAETAVRLSEQYLMKDMGPVSTYLGMQLLCDTEGIKLSQSVYISGILTRFGMADSKAVSTPAVDFSGDAPGELCDKTLYRQIVGSLMHLMVVSRPDLAFSVGKLARFMHEPHDVHMIAAKRVLRYLKGTSGFACYFVVGGCLSRWDTRTPISQEIRYQGAQLLGCQFSLEIHQWCGRVEDSLLLLCRPPKRNMFHCVKRQEWSRGCVNSFVSWDMSCRHQQLYMKTIRHALKWQKTLSCHNAQNTLTFSTISSGIVLFVNYWNFAISRAKDNLPICIQKCWGE